MRVIVSVVLANSQVAEEGRKSLQLRDVLPLPRRASDRSMADPSGDGPSSTSKVPTLAADGEPTTELSRRGRVAAARPKRRLPP